MLLSIPGTIQAVPLLNMRGEVIGINSAIFSTTGQLCVGFAIPSNTIAQVVPSLIKNRVHTSIHGLGLQVGI